MKYSIIYTSALAALSTVVSSAPASSGHFNCLSMNVAGLPEILQSNDESGDKTANTQIIGEDFAKYGYDFIHVQEDFNYHATLYKYDNHTYRTATSGGAAIGSGLNTLSNYPWVDFTRVKWNTCSDASSNDCETPKGFTFMRARLDEGVFIDFYNLHADAGTETGDETARNANLQQVLDYVNLYSNGNAVLIFGDTNSRYTRSSDGIRIFSNAGFTDSWVQQVENGVAPTQGADAIVCDNPTTVDTCETVDKMFFRSNNYIKITDKGFYYDSERFLQSNNNTLTDHNPIRSEFSYELNPNYSITDFVGGPHGTWFNDLPSLSSIVATLNLRGANRLDSIGVVLADGTSLTHGGTGGASSSATLSSGDYFNSATLCSDDYNSETRVFYASFTSKNGVTITSGTKSGDCSTFNAPPGYGLAGFDGQDGDEIDQLAIIWSKQ